MLVVNALATYHVAPYCSVSMNQLTRVASKMDVYVVCDICKVANPETISSYYMDDDGYVATICFKCQPTNG